MSNIGSDEELQAAWVAMVEQGGRDACLSISVVTALHRKRTFGGVPRAGQWYTPMQSPLLLEHWLISHGVDVSRWGQQRRRMSSGAGGQQQQQQQQQRASSSASSAASPAAGQQAEQQAEQAQQALAALRLKSVADLYDELRRGKMLLYETPRFGVVREIRIVQVRLHSSTLVYTRP